MKTRPAYELRFAMFTYNVLLIIINGNYLVKSLSWIDYGRELWNFDFPSSDDYSPKAMRIVNEFYAYSLTKFIDYLDTVFFILRKKNRQITALHIYHHVSVPIVGWICSWVNSFNYFFVYKSLITVFFGALDQSDYANIRFICRTKLYRSHVNVWILCPECIRSSITALPMVETLSHPNTTRPISDHRRLWCHASNVSQQLSP